MIGEDGDGAQLHTLEGFTAAFIVLFAMLFSLQAIAITPTSSSTASQEVERVNYDIVGDILSASEANGDLRTSLLEWQNTTVGFNGSTEGVDYYAGRGDVENLSGIGDTLQILDERGIAYNVYIRCDGRQVNLVKNGDETLHSVAATTTVNLYDEEKVADGGKLENTDYLGEGVCGNVEGTVLYNTVEVKITAWRM